MKDQNLISTLDELIEILQDRLDIEAKTGLDLDQELVNDIENLIQMKDYIEKMTEDLTESTNTLKK